MPAIRVPCPNRENGRPSGEMDKGIEAFVDGVIGRRALPEEVTI